MCVITRGGTGAKVHEARWTALYISLLRDVETCVAGTAQLNRVGEAGGYRSPSPPTSARSRSNAAACAFCCSIDAEISMDVTVERRRALGPGLESMDEGVGLPREGRRTGVPGVFSGLDSGSFLACKAPLSSTGSTGSGTLASCISSAAAAACSSTSVLALTGLLVAGSSEVLIAI